MFNVAEMVTLNVCSFKSLRRSGVLLHCCDSFLCLAVFFPSMVLYWRGIWDLWGVYVLPDQFPLQQWILLAVGATSIVGYFCAPLLDAKLKTIPRVVGLVLTRVYWYIYAALYMCYWRGHWTLADYYLSMELMPSLINTIVCYSLLAVCGCTRCVIFSPMYTILDTRSNALVPSTRFNTQPYSVHYTLDCIFSHYLILSLAVWCWRGMFNLEYCLVYPDDPHYGDFFCFVVGCISFICVFLLEEPLARASLKLELWGGFWTKLIFQDAVYLMIFLLEGLLWRGGWNLTTRYIIPDPELGGWVCFITGTILLTSLQLFSYVGAHGVSIDGQDYGRDAIFPTKYLRHYLLEKSSQSTYVVNDFTIETKPESIKTKLPTDGLYDNVHM